MIAALKELRRRKANGHWKLETGQSTELMVEEKMEQFQKMMNQIIGRAIEENNEKLSQDISRHGKR